MIKAQDGRQDSNDIYTQVWALHDDVLFRAQCQKNIVEVIWDTHHEEKDS